MSYDRPQPPAVQVSVRLADGTVHPLDQTAAEIVAWVVVYASRLNDVTNATLEFNWRPGTLEPKLREHFKPVKTGKAD